MGQGSYRGVPPRQVVVFSYPTAQNLIIYQRIADTTYRAACFCTYALARSLVRSGTNRSDQHVQGVAIRFG